MRSGAGKAKGNAFERDCCRKLSLWISDGERDDLFWRSAASGGRATFISRTSGGTRLAAAQAGDVTAIDLAGFPLAAQVVVECKFYKRLQIAEGLIKGTGSLVQFWHRVCAEAKTYGKQPVLIARQNLLPTLLIVRSDSLLFSGVPILSSPAWDAKFYLFEEATRVERPKMKRRG